MTGNLAITSAFEDHFRRLMNYRMRIVALCSYKPFPLCGDHYNTFIINLFDIKNLYELRLILFTKVISSAAFNKDPFCAHHFSVVKAKIIYTIQINIA